MTKLRFLPPLLPCILCLPWFSQISEAQKAVPSAWIKGEPKPQWIWTTENVRNDDVFFRHSFDLKMKPKSAPLYTTADNTLDVWINGKKAGSSPAWQQPVIIDAAEFLKVGKNTIAARASNQGGVAAFVFKLQGGAGNTILSGKDWKYSKTNAAGWNETGFDDSGWSNKSVKEVHALGGGPWGIPSPSEAAAAKKQRRGGGVALPSSELTLAKGFTADLLYTVPKSEQGSWVALCANPDGSFYVSDQGDKGLFKIAISGNGAEVEPVPLNQPDGKKLSAAQGLLWAFDSLWFHRNGGHLYRVIDTNGDGSLDKVEKQPSNTGGGEHGNHSLILDESGGKMYVVGGNAAPVPPSESLARRRVQSWNEDHLLPRMWDARGHARGRLAPAGWISLFDPKSKTHDLYSIGFRNEYDATLNSAGDLFAYDADMEWDMGSYWYRPTRINFVASGSDHGWRSGTGKWPAYYEDSLPPVVEIGPGSPTGLVAGTGARFPAKYQRALYAHDWTFGTIWAIHLEQNGAGYTGKKEVFAAGVPLPVTDGVIGKDGHLYFLIGGRGAQSALYRIRYSGDESTAPAAPLAPTPEREIARSLEAFHGVNHTTAVLQAWPHLSSPDPFLRHAARVAIESQPFDQWGNRVLSEKNPQALITGAVALARCGDNSMQAGLVDSLLALDFGALTESQQLGLLRAYALTFVRLGKPNEEQRAAVIAEIDSSLPGESANLNTELIRVLSYLQSPTVVEKAVALITRRGDPEVPDWAEIAARNPGYGATVKRFLDNAPPSREVYYAMMIANVRSGWTVEARRACIELLNEASKGAGGASFPGFLTNIRNLHLGAMSNEQRVALADISGENFNPVPDFEIKPVKGPGQNYSVESASKHLNFRKADFENGRSLFFSATCGACHRLNGLGGDIGPDLTSVPNKFDNRYVLEAIINPSKDISDQYGMFEVTLNDGTVKMGLVVENEDEVSIYPPDHTAKPTLVSPDMVKEVKQLEISQMPPGLLNLLNPDEVRDLMAYLMSGGDPKSKVYRK